MRVRELSNLAIGTRDYYKGNVARHFYRQDGNPQIKFISVKQNGVPVSFATDHDRNRVGVSWDGHLEHEVEKQYLYELVCDADDQFQFEGGKATLDIETNASGFGYPIKQYKLSIELPKAVGVELKTTSFGDVVTDDSITTQILEDGKKIVYQHSAKNEDSRFWHVIVDLEEEVVARPSCGKWWQWTWAYHANLIL